MFSITTVIDILPGILAEKFSSDGKTSALSIVAGSKFFSWFKSSGLPFFAHYTDHTFDHALDVFRTAIELIPEETWDTLTSTDISILLLSCLLHDCGLHITESQFQKLRLIDTPTYYAGIEEESWKTLWDAFLQEARRFNEDKLKNIFGDTKPVHEIPGDESDFTNRDKALIGEFLRRHHPRLAYEVAMGLGQTLGGVDPLADLDRPLRMLIGLIGRSHGEAMRQNLDFVSSEFDLRDFQGIHAVYLMALLRIADLGQIQSARAPTTFTKLHNVRSPISAREWRVHQSVLYINQAHEDPEALYVDARPVNVVDFSRVREWLEDLQKELDAAWAVLGEVYGRVSSPPLHLLKLRIRRVRSNIFDRNRKFDFVPEAFSFRVAEAEMLSLLLAPLYGDHAIYGLRELVQNARDATEERQASELGAAKLPVSVEIFDLDSRAEIVVTDDGVGMTLDVIRSYFLNAGASFRSSEEWRAKFEGKDGSSKVARSGRFGVGALAAFLLGKTITVTTRHHLDTTGSGYTFTCSLGDKDIEIREVVTSVGTTIVIQSNSDRLNQLNRARRAIGDLFRQGKNDLDIKHISSDGSIVIRNEETKEFTELKEFSTNSFDRVLVSYYERSYYYSGRESSVYINGIAIAELRDENLSFSSSIYRKRPLTAAVAFPGYYGSGEADTQVGFVIEIEDRNAHARVNLARTSINSYDQELTEEIDNNLYQHYKEEIGEYFSIISDDDQFYRVNGWFKISPNSIAFVAGAAVPNDTDILKAHGVRHVVRCKEAPSQLIALSKRYSDFAFICGEPPSTTGEAQHYMRDLKHSFGSSEENTALVRLSSEWRKKLAASKGTAKWMTEILQDPSTSDWLTFGAEIPEIEKVMLDLSSNLHSSSIEIFSNVNADFRWRRWHSRQVAKSGVFSRLWLADDHMTPK